MKDNLISTLSEIRSNYNCLDEAEEPYYRALSEAIKKLSERVDRDTISRKLAIDTISNMFAPTPSQKDMVEDCLEIIDNLPPAQPKSGQWVKHDTYYDCSRCSCIAPCTETADSIIWKLSDFCPDCGARMQNTGRIIEMLSAQPETHGKRTETHACDCISREAAIDAVCAVCGDDCDKSEFVYNAPQDEKVILCPEHYVLCTLPPAQSEPEELDFVQPHKKIGVRLEIGQPEQKWTPCSDPSDLPKDERLWITREIYGVRIVYDVIWDMTEWSDSVSGVVAYMPYWEPEPYTERREE